jgi:hypothetical protein
LNQFRELQYQRGGLSFHLHLLFQMRGPSQYAYAVQSNMLHIWHALAVDVIHAIMRMPIVHRQNIPKCIHQYAVAVVLSMRRIYHALAPDAILAIQMQIALNCDAHPSVAVMFSAWSQYLWADLYRLLKWLIVFALHAVSGIRIIRPARVFVAIVTILTASAIFL